eukprot:7083317-Ditylum_brightwellii.AAC.1
MKDHLDEFLPLGIEKVNLECHSARKGAITLISSGCTVSPPLASICLHAGWSMGPVNERCIHYKKAGDQFVGQSVTGISTLVPEFATSPYYFDYTCAPIGTKEQIDNIIDKKLVKRENVPGIMVVLLRFLFAAICYHYDLLNAELPPSSKLQRLPLFAEASRHCNHEFAYVKFL